MAQIATQSLAVVKTMNSPDLSLKSDLIANNNGWNYKANEFGVPF